MGYSRVVLQDATRNDPKRENRATALFSESTARDNFYTRLGFRPSAEGHRLEWTHPSHPRERGWKSDSDTSNVPPKKTHRQRRRRLIPVRPKETDFSESGSELSDRPRKRRRNHRRLEESTGVLDDLQVEDLENATRERAPGSNTRTGQNLER